MMARKSSRVRVVTVAVDVQAQAAVHLVAAHLGQVVALLVEEEALEAAARATSSLGGSPGRSSW